jgi:hypothetical protein
MGAEKVLVLLSAASGSGGGPAETNSVPDGCFEGKPSRGKLKPLGSFLLMQRKTCVAHLPSPARFLAKKTLSTFFHEKEV